MPPEVSLPESLRGVEPVRSVRTPAQLDYEFTAGEGVHIEPLKLFSDKHDSVDAIPDGATIAITNDVSNQYRGRINEVQNEIEVESDSLLVNFYDNGEVDGDSISVFYNDQLLSFNRLLSARAIQFRIGLNPAKEYNEITMFADNLGTISPNTALMIVYDGTKRHDVRLSSNLEKNATVRIRKKKSPGK